MNIRPPITPLQGSAKVGELAPGETTKVYFGVLGVIAALGAFSVWHTDKYWKPKR